MLNNAPPGMHGNSLPSGWSNSEKFIEFLEHFIHHVKPTKDKVLLLMGNHESHVLIAAITKVKENGIIMLTSPPPTHTHTQSIGYSHWTDTFPDPLKILQYSMQQLDAD
jgi:hypothetical protein